MKCFKRAELCRLIRLRAPGFERAIEPAKFWRSDPYVVINEDHPAWRVALARFDVPAEGPIPYDRWPSFARRLAGCAFPAEAGLGDIVGRLASTLGDPSIVRFFFRRLLDGPLPSSPLSVLNIRFPLAQGDTRHV
jgi:hypothetical protein